MNQNQWQQMRTSLSLWQNNTFRKIHRKWCCQAWPSGMGSKEKDCLDHWRMCPEWSRDQQSRERKGDQVPGLEVCSERVMEPQLCWSHPSRRWSYRVDERQPPRVPWHHPWKTTETWGPRSCSERNNIHPQKGTRSPFSLSSVCESVAPGQGPTSQAHLIKD